jgi:hypothetical protein
LVGAQRSVREHPLPETAIAELTVRFRVLSTKPPRTAR